MNKKRRFISMLLTFALLVSMFSILGASAAAPTSLDIARIADVSDDVALAFEGAIAKGAKDTDGIYFKVSYPALNLGDCDLTYAEYTLMAANAIVALGEGKATSTQISYKAVKESNQPALNGAGTSLNKAQYLELAERVAKYGNTMGSLPTSFNRPTDGTNIYEGRMTIYSIAHLFAEVLASYHTNKALPATVEFIPVHYGDVNVTEAPVAPSAPEDWFKAVMEAAATVKASMANNILPGSIAVGPLTVTPAQFLYLACKVTVALSAGTTSGTLTVPVAAEPGNPQGTTTGQSDETDYVDMANRIATYIENNKQAPNYATSNGLSGPVNYYDLIDAYARVVAYYKDNGFTPNYVTIKGWAGTVQDVTTPATTATTTPTTKPTTAPTETTTASTAASTAPSTSAPMTDDWYTNVIIAATNVKNYVASNEDMPATITVGTTSCKPAQYLYLACQVVIGINNGQTTGSLSVPSYSEPGGPNSTLTAGTFKKTEYLDILTRIKTFMENNGQAPNYASTSLGQIQHEGAIYMAACILDYFAQNGKLPDSIAVKPWYEYLGITSGDASFGNDFSAYKQYMVPTSNCQSTNATIISVAKTGMAYSSGSHGGYKKPSTTYEAMFNLMEYMNAKIAYDYYYDTQQGALGTWNAKSGNCCDMAHLMNACARSLGVPGRYEHWYCKFAVSQTGHVWSSVYCPDGPTAAKSGWLPADPVNDPNYLGYQNHTNISRYGIYATLPF
ncbi:MAG: transglutaminase domain-containing protein [Oscillospiraceae bacterium]|nr:transglutaminase domain-containing protein [Oscillospiraceae bacterium]